MSSLADCLCKLSDSPFEEALVCAAIHISGKCICLPRPCTVDPLMACVKS